MSLSPNPELESRSNADNADGEDRDRAEELALEAAPLAQSLDPSLDQPLESTSPEMEAESDTTPPGTAVEPGAESNGDSLPVPAGPLRNELTQPKDEGAKPSFWKRFRMRRKGEGDESTTSNTPKLARDPQVGVRLDSIERKIDDFDATLREQLDAVHVRLEEVWESEEQLSHLTDIQDKLDRLSQSHQELSAGIASLRRTTLGLAVLIVLASVASALVYSTLA